MHAHTHARTQRLHARDPALLQQQEQQHQQWQQQRDQRQREFQQEHAQQQQQQGEEGQQHTEQRQQQQGEEEGGAGSGGAGAMRLLGEPECGIGLQAWRLMVRHPLMGGTEAEPAVFEAGTPWWRA